MESDEKDESELTTKELIDILDKKEYVLFTLTYIQNVELFAIPLIILMTILVFFVWNCFNMSEFGGFADELYETVNDLRLNGYFPQ